MKFGSEKQPTSLKSKTICVELHMQFCGSLNSVNWPKKASNDTGKIQICEIFLANLPNNFLLQLTGSRGSSFRRQVRTCRSQSVSHWRGVQCQRVPHQVHAIIGPFSPFCPCGRLATWQHHKSWAAQPAWKSNAPATKDRLRFWSGNVAPRM